MKKYLFRVMKYLIYFIILFIVVYTLLVLTGTNNTENLSFMNVLSSTNGRIMLAILLIMSFLYPIIGSTHKVITYMDKDIVIEQMNIIGYRVDKEIENNIVIFRAKRLIDRLFMKFDDHIRVEFSNENVTFYGTRKAITRVARHINSLR
ncbi:MAG: hypothetical protein IMY73_05100 [Bacteroidetes bacterium]|nr:hypothetical protein [Bacteroidota bacterium]